MSHMHALGVNMFIDHHHFCMDLRNPDEVDTLPMDFSVLEAEQMFLRQINIVFQALALMYQISKVAFWVHGHH